MSPRERKPIPVYYWPFWLLLLAGGLFVFYIVLTPIWMGIRFVSWLAERRGMQEPSSPEEI